MDFMADVLGETGSRQGILGRAMEKLAKSAEPGAIVLVRMGMGEQIARTLGSLEAGAKDVDGAHHHPLREYGVGAQILKDLGVRRMIHLSNSPPTHLPGLDGYGLSVEGWSKIDE